MAVIRRHESLARGEHVIPPRGYLRRMSEGPFVGIVGSRHPKEEPDDEQQEIVARPGGCRDAGSYARGGPGRQSEIRREGLLLSELPLPHRGLRGEGRTWTRLLLR